MVYCQKCGSKNEDDAKYCKSCSSSLAGRERGREWEDERCEEECSGRRGSSVGITILIVIFALVAVGIIVNLVMKLFQPNMPSWMMNFQYWDVLGLLIALAIIVMIITALARVRREPPRHRV